MSSRKTEAYWVENRSRWQIKVQVDGERKIFTSSTPGKRGKIEAEKKADNWLEHRLVDENAKVETIAQEFLAHIDQSESSSYYRQQKMYVDNYIVPEIGRKKVSKVTENDLQRIIDKAHKKGLARKTLSNLRGCLVAVIKYARKSKCTTLLPESLTIPSSAPRSNKVILSPKDLHKLLTIAETEKRGKPEQEWFIHAYRLAVLTGLRPGETLALKWSDIKDGVLHVQRSLNCAGELTRGKNDNADRYIALTGLAEAEIEAQRQQLIDAGLPLKWVFPLYSTGEPPCQNTYYLTFVRYQRYNNFKPVVSPYELRHTFVSINDEMPDGLKRKTVGHSKSMDTEGTYGHRLAGDIQRAAQYSDDAFRRAIGSLETMSESTH